MKIELLAELDALQQRDGRLYADALVAHAADPTTAWHAKFPWDDADAAREHRLWLARRYIAVAVTILPRTGGQRCRTFVSLTRDRIEPRGGYRPLVDVLDDAGLRQHLLADALQALQRLRQKYATLRELDTVWSAMDAVATTEQEAVA